MRQIEKIELIRNQTDVRCRLALFFFPISWDREKEDGLIGRIDYRTRAGGGSDRTLRGRENRKSISVCLQ